MIAHPTYPCIHRRVLPVHGALHREKHLQLRPRVLAQLQEHVVPEEVHVQRVHVDAVHVELTLTTYIDRNIDRHIDI